MPIKHISKIKEEYIPNVRVTGEMKERYELLAKKNDMKITQYVFSVLAGHLNAIDEKKANRRKAKFI